MADFALAQWIRPPLEDLASRLAALGLGSLALIFASLLAGLAALPAIALGHFWLGLVLILLSRLIDAIGRVGVEPRELRLAAAFELIFLASIPFAFALNDPASALSAALLLFGLIAAGASALFASDARALKRSDVFICVAAFALACLRPQWFALIAYMLALFCFVAAGARIALVFARSGA
jgi:hypothetical protein